MRTYPRWKWLIPVVPIIGALVGASGLTVGPWRRLNAEAAAGVFNTPLTEVRYPAKHQVVENAAAFEYVTGVSNTAKDIDYIRIDGEGNGEIIYPAGFDASSEVWKRSSVKATVSQIDRLREEVRRIDYFNLADE